MNPLIEARAFSCQIDGRSVFRDLSFRLERGQKLGLLGANGAGKTTLINALLGFIPYQGSVLIDGKELRDDVQCIRDLSGVVFSCIDDQLLLPTVADEIAYGLIARGYGEAEKADLVTGMLNQMNLSQVGSRPPFELSSGEKQKTALASVLIANPQLLLLDEPTKEIDCRTKKKLIALLRGLDCAMIVSSHDYEFVQETCSQVFVLDQERGAAMESVVFLSDRDWLRNFGLL